MVAHKEQLGGFLPALHRIPVYDSLDDLPRSASLRTIGYLPAFVGSMIPCAVDAAMAEDLISCESRRDRVLEGLNSAAGERGDDCWKGFTK